VGEARRNVVLVMQPLLVQVREPGPLPLLIRIGSLGVAGDATQQTIWPEVVCKTGNPGHPLRVRIHIDLLGDVGDGNRPTIWPKIVRRAGSLGHRYVTATECGLPLLKGKLKISCKLTTCVTVCCVMLRVWSLKNSVVMPAGNLVTSQRLNTAKM